MNGEGHSINFVRERIAEVTAGGQFVEYWLSEAYFPQRRALITLHHHGGELGAIRCAGVNGIENHPLDWGRCGRTVSLEQKDFIEIKLDQNVTVQTESICFETENAYRYIKDIENGKGRYPQSRVVADIEAFFQSVTPAELQGELIFYKSPPNSYDELLCNMKYRGRTFYGVFATTRSFRMDGNTFNGLNVVHFNDHDIEIARDDGKFAVKADGFFVHVGANLPLPLGFPYKGIKAFFARRNTLEKFIERQFRQQAVGHGF